MTLKEYFAQVILVYSIKEMEENVYMKRLLVYSKKYWIQMIAAAISSVTASISTVMVIDILREIIDPSAATEPQQEPGRARRAGGTAAVAAFGRP